jgi:peptidoglycan/LPS O-acetylase OafA/YrhL
VQLFFLASSLTLLMSWNSEVERKGRVDAVAFFIRRFFRIAPAYYLAGIFYYFIEPPRNGFDAWQAIASMAFINAWHPVWTPTVAGAWSVVPGGWSIGVEFTFYMLFPLFATWVTSLNRALLAFAAGVAIGYFANRIALAALGKSYTLAEIGNFLFFWFPNQMSVFALGGVTYFLIRKTGAPGCIWGAVLRKRAAFLAAASIMVFCALAYVPLGHFIGATPIVPASLAVTVPLMGFIIALSGDVKLLVNRSIALMGTISFSAYLIHFSVLRLFDIFPTALHTHARGIASVGAFTIGLVVAIAVTFAASWLSYRAIELPMISAGRSLVRGWRERPARLAALSGT